VCVLYGRCEEEVGTGYQPIADALTHLVVHGEESLLTQHTAEHGGALLPLVPALSKRVQGLSEGRKAGTDEERIRLFAAVDSLISLASMETGLLLVLDDLHWADKATLQMLRHVVASTELTNVMVVGTYRSSEITTGHPLSDTLASLRREADASRIALAGLEAFEIVEMMEHIAGHDMDESGWQLAHAIRKETDGNPFFTTEMLRHLVESGLVREDEESGRWVASDDLYEKGLPGSVREVVGQRVDRLGEEMRKVLSQASVIGQEFDLALLTKIVDVDEDHLLDLVDEATKAGLLVEVEGALERFRFAHALTQHTLYNDMGASRRTRGHRKVAEALVEMYGDSDERAQDVIGHVVDATLSFPRFTRNEMGTLEAPADALR
jgi:predicted ATPase